MTTPLNYNNAFTVTTPLNYPPLSFLLQNDILFTVQIQNVMLSPVFLETVQFEPATGFTSQDLTITKQGYLTTPTLSQIFSVFSH